MRPTGNDDPRNQPRDSDNVDVLIVGAGTPASPAHASSDALKLARFPDLLRYAGPAGLAAAIKLKQMANEQGKEVRVVVLEKAADVGALPYPMIGPELP